MSSTCKQNGDLGAIAVLYRIFINSEDLCSNSGRMNTVKKIIVLGNLCYHEVLTIDIEVGFRSVQ